MHKCITFRSQEANDFLPNVASLSYACVSHQLSDVKKCISKKHISYKKQSSAKSKWPA